jgi:hypothetical protein
VRPNQYPGLGESLKYRLLALATAAGLLAVSACSSTTNHNQAATQSGAQVVQVKPNVAPPTPAITPEQAQLKAVVQTTAENFAARVVNLCKKQLKTPIPKNTDHSGLRCDVIAGNTNQDTPPGIYGLNVVGAFDGEGSIVPGSVVWVSMSILNPGAGNVHNISLSKDQHGWSIQASKPMVPGAAAPESINLAASDAHLGDVSYILEEAKHMLSTAELGRPFLPDHS